MEVLIVSITNEFKLSVDGAILIKYRGTDGILELPKSVIEIGNEAFSECSNLKYINIPEGVTKIGKGAFQNCESLKEVKIPDSIVKIEENSFSGCKSLTHLIIPDSVTEIGKGALSYCSSLSEIDMPKNVTRIEDYAFVGCRKLRAIKIPDSVTYMGIRVFGDCSNLIKVELSHNIHKIANQTFDGCHKLQDFMIPDWITEIGSYAFRGCDAMEKIQIHAEIIKIAEAPFQSRKLKEISVYGSNPIYESYDGVLFEVKGKTKKLINFPGAREGYYRIPDGTTHININAFAESKLSLIEIPFGVKLQDRIIDSDNTSIKLTGTFLQQRNAFTSHYGDYLKHAEIKPIDLAYMILYQDRNGIYDISKNLEKELKKKSLNFSEVIDHMVDILKKENKKSVDKKAVEFILEYNKKVNSVSFKKLYTALQEIDSSQAKVLESDWRFNLLWHGKNANEYTVDTDHPIERIVQGNWESSDFTEKLRDVIVKGVKYANSEKYSSKEVLIFVLASYAGQEKKKIPIGDYKSDYFDVKISPAADEVAKAFDQNQFLCLLESLAYKGREEYLLPYGRYSSGKQVTQMILEMKSWENWGVHGADGRKKIIIARSALLLSDTREAMIEIDKSGLLKIYAKIRGVTEDSIRNNVLSDFGLDDTGMKEYKLGNRKLTVTLSKDLTYMLYDSEAKKYFKSIPKRDTDPQLFELAKFDFDEMKKNLKKVVKARTDTLFEYFLSGKTYKYSEWQESFIQNPIFHRLSELLVWSQDGDTFIVTPERYMTSDEKTFEIRKSVPVGLAHPIEMKSNDLEQWRHYLIKNNLKQPFLQIWEPAIKPEEIKKDRYLGTQISVFSVMNQIKHGIKFSYHPYNGEMKLDLKGCKIEYERTKKQYRGDIEKDETLTLGEFTYESANSKANKILARKDDFSQEELNDEYKKLLLEHYESILSKLNNFSETYTRQINHIVFLLDRWIVRSGIRNDNCSIMDRISSFTFAQIIEFLDLAMESGSRNCIALLLNYKNEQFNQFDQMTEFTLD